MSAIPHASPWKPFCFSFTPRIRAPSLAPISLAVWLHWAENSHSRLISLLVSTPNCTRCLTPLRHICATLQRDSPPAAKSRISSSANIGAGIASSSTLADAIHESFRLATSCLLAAPPIPTASEARLTNSCTHLQVHGALFAHSPELLTSWNLPTTLLARARTTPPTLRHSHRSWCPSNR